MGRREPWNSSRFRWVTISERTTSFAWMTNMGEGCASLRELLVADRGRVRERPVRWWRSCGIQIVRSSVEFSRAAAFVADSKCPGDDEMPTEVTTMGHAPLTARFVRNEWFRFSLLDKLASGLTAGKRPVSLRESRRKRVMCLCYM